jgi:hypothetical protein
MFLICCSGRINVEGAFCLPCSTWKRASNRSFRVYSLFGGKKEKDENGDEAPSKVRKLLTFAL